MDNILIYYLRVSQHLSQQFRSHFGKINLTFPQALALNILTAQGSIPISKLAELTGSANSTISGVVDRLEKLGLAKRTRSEADHRVIYVEATDKYTKLRTQAATGVSEFFDDLLKDLDAAQREQIAHSLELLDKALTADQEEN